MVQQAILSASEVLKTLEDHGADLRSRGVLKLGLFGSIARGEATENSDLDFVVEMEPVTFGGFMGLIEYLEDLFEHRVDVGFESTLKPVIRERVLNETLYVPGFSSVS